MEYHVLPLTRLIEHFERLPGIGKKSAQRLAFYVLNLPKEKALDFANCIVEAQEKIKHCKVCQNLTDNELCPICQDASRENVVCVVEDPRDVLAFERTKEYNGLYHVLHGLISPMDGIGPDQLYVKELLQRIGQGKIKEVIMATNPTVEGEATAMYLSRLIKPLGIRVTRLAYGIPVGSGGLSPLTEFTMGLSHAECDFAFELTVIPFCETIIDSSVSTGSVEIFSSRHLSVSHRQFRTATRNTCQHYQKLNRQNFVE